MSSVSFLNLVTQVFSPFALNGLDKDLSIWFIFSKNQIFLKTFLIFLVSTKFTSTLIM